MSYKKTVWEDRKVQYPERCDITPNGDGTYTVIPAVGDVIKEGVRVDAEKLNKLETQYEKAKEYTDSKTVKIDFDIIDGGGF